MAFATCSSDKLISLLSSAKEWIPSLPIHRQAVNPRIQHRSKVHHHIQRQSSTSSLGSLGILPLELLHLISNELDFTSLSHLGQVSLRGREVVQSVPAYRILREHAVEALSDLASTKTMPFHSVATVLAALRSESCVLCGDFAPFLFLTSCERCCFSCLTYNPSFNMIDVRAARRFFRLSAEQLKHLPILNDTRVLSWRAGKDDWWAPAQLMRIKDVKTVALAIHGSEEALVKHVEDMQTLDQVKTLALAIVKAPVQMLQYNQTRVPNEAIETMEMWYGIARTRFPYLGPGNTVEHGLWCQGCQERYTEVRQRRLSPADVNIWSKEGERLLAAGCKPKDILLGFSIRAWSKPQFLEHVKDCREARKCLLRVAIGNLKPTISRVREVDVHP